MTRYARIRGLALLSLIAVVGGCAGPAPPPTPAALADSSITPFTNVAATALKDGHQLWNDRPGVVVFDYDRDGDLDIYLTSEGGHANLLYRNEGDGPGLKLHSPLSLTFANVAREAGVMAVGSFSTGAVACDLDNDGFQDLYVGAWGSRTDGLDFRSPSEGQGNRDSLFRNNGDGTFRDITDMAFGVAVNARSATSIACADVDGDGWLDIYVGNVGADDFRTFDSASHPGHYNMLYRNLGDLTFAEIAQEAGVRGPQISMRDPEGRPIMFEDPETGERFEGYDPATTDRLGNRVGEPTGQTHAALFFDYDDDGDPDLWLANDGDRLHLFRNDSMPGRVRFTPVAREMGIDKVGSWMGFAVGDQDGDGDLDVFVTNIGYHPLLRPPPQKPSGACPYHHRFAWGTCGHALLRNDGTRDVAGVGKIGVFPDMGPSTNVKPSPLLPPDALDPARIHPLYETPTGLEAYDFGFGVTFFDYDNDGAQDLYWLGSTIARGEAVGGDAFPGVGRMLRGDGRGAFEDVTVRARLLDIERVKYDEPFTVGQSLEARRIGGRFHENGKGLAHGDLDGDGYVDLIGSNSSGPKLFGDDVMDVPGPVFVWRNGSGNNHWIALRLRGRMAIDGTGSNADGIGARVYLTANAPGDAGSLVQVQEVRAGSSYLSMDSIDLEFGLGVATLVDEITILWPSGRRQTLTDVAVDQVLVVEEPGS